MDVDDVGVGWSFAGYSHAKGQLRRAMDKGVFTRLLTYETAGTTQ